MVVKILLCQMCGERFEAEVLDLEDPSERRQEGRPATCPGCRSPRLEVVRLLRRIRSAG